MHVLSKILRLIKNFFFKINIRRKFSVVDKGNEKKNNFPLSGVYNYDYILKPKVSLIIHHFISEETLKKTLLNLKNYNLQMEVIIINDKFFPLNDIYKIIDNSNFIIINTKDYGEARSYIKGAKISRSTDFLIFCQDDDLLPGNEKWLDDCLGEFNNDDKLGLVGLNGGGVYKENFETINFSRIYQNKKSIKKYCSWLKFGPFVIRKSVYNKIGGIKLFGLVGETSNGVDRYLTLEVIKEGYKSMLLLNENTKQIKRRFVRDDGLSVSDLKKHKMRNLSFEDSEKKFLELAKDDISAIQRKPEYQYE